MLGLSFLGLDFFCMWFGEMVAIFGGIGHLQIFFCHFQNSIFGGVSNSRYFWGVL